MDSQFRVRPMLQPTSADLTPQDILMAANNDPQAVLHYILSLESEVNRLQLQLVVSREEMFNAIQVSMSTVASEMSKTLNVTKNSLVGIQEKFHNIAASRVDGIGATRPGVMKHYEKEGLGNQAILDRKESAVIFNDIFDCKNGKGKLDLLTSQNSLQPGQIDEMSLTLNSNTKTTPVRYIPAKILSGSGSTLNSFRVQESAVFLSANANTESKFATTSSIYEPSPTRTVLHSSKAFAVKSPTNAEITFSTPTLSIRTDSQKNARKVGSATEAFMEYMADSHKKQRSYRTTPQPKIGNIASTGSIATASEDFREIDNRAAIKSKFSRPTGPTIKYDVAFLKNVGKSCKGWPNPFAGNKDEELKPVLEWTARGRSIKFIRKSSRPISKNGTRPNTTSGWF